MRMFLRNIFKVQFVTEGILSRFSEATSVLNNNLLNSCCYDIEVPLGTVRREGEPMQYMQQLIML